MPNSDVIEISRANPYGTVFVLAVNPTGGNNGGPVFMYGTEFDIYEGFYGPSVNRCGSYDEVRDQLEFEAGFDDDFASVAAGFIDDLDNWVAS